MIDLFIIPVLILAFSNLVKLGKDTIIETTFRTIGLGFILDFIYSHYSMIFVLTLTCILYRWIKNVRLLLAICVVLLVLAEVLF